VANKQDRVPPYDDEAERAVLGSVLLNSDRVMPIIQERRMSPKQFYVPANRTIMQAILDVSAGSKGFVNLITLADGLGADKDSVGGDDYLHGLIDGVPIVAHVVSYIQIVEQKHKLREIIRTSREAEAAAYEDEPAEEIIASMVAASSSIAYSNSDGKCEDFHAEHVKRRVEAKEGKCGFPTPSWMSDIVSFWHPPHNVVIAGGSTMGKTTLALDFVLPQLFAGTPVGVVSLDMNEYDLRERLAASIAGVNNHLFTKSFWTDAQAAKIDEGYKVLAKLPLYILDSSTTTCDDIVSWTTAMVARHGIKFLIVDFLQIIQRTEVEWRRDMRIVVSDWVKRIKGLGKRFDIVTMPLSQVTRSTQNSKKDETPPRPSMTSLMESGSIEQDADIVILISFEEGQPYDQFTYVQPIWDMNCDIAKQRNGPTGNIKCCRYVTRNRFLSREFGQYERSQIEQSRREETLASPEVREEATENGPF